ncbi:MAG: hypothetical protein IOD12_15835 [Silvanigrellales bacterium]|nr:hypothetical protein [Silvanigrellales bacterium]
MQQNPIILPLDLPPDEARVSWNGTYYAVSAALGLPGRAETAADIDLFLDASLLIFKLVPFRDKLRSRMLSLLADPDEENKTTAPAQATPADPSPAVHARPAWGVVARLSVRDAKIQGLDDVRKAFPVAGAPAGKEFDPTLAASVSLSEEDAASLQSALQTYVAKTLAPFLSEPFASFAPEIARTEGLGAWTDRVKPTRKADTLVPYMSLFPNAFPIDLEVAGEEYLIDDLYCTRASCPCVDVTCVILKNDKASGKSVAHAGFKYNIETGKSKAMSEFPTKINVAEWFKRFSHSHPVSLDLLLASRYHFMRKNYIEARDGARK